MLGQEMVSSHGLLGTRALHRWQHWLQCIAAQWDGTSARTAVSGHQQHMHCPDYSAVIIARLHVQSLLHMAIRQRAGQPGIGARRLLDLTKG